MQQQNNEEIDRIRAAKAGDRLAFSWLVERYQSTTYNICYRLLNDREAAEDAAQESFLRAYLKLETYDEHRKFATWLYSIASHYCLDQLKRRRPAAISWDELGGWQHPTAGKATQPEAAVISHETAQLMQSLIGSLPVEYRTVIILKYWQQCSCGDIAAVLNTSVSAVKSRLFRARRLMAVNLAEIDGPQQSQARLNHRRQSTAFAATFPQLQQVPIARQAGIHLSA